jgi:hypothetical protein
MDGGGGCFVLLMPKAHNHLLNWQYGRPICLHGGNNIRLNDALKSLAILLQTQEL